MNAVEIMIRNPVTIWQGASLSQAVQLMIDRRISGLPVVDANGEVVGMLSEGDLLRRQETGTEKPASWLKVFLMPARVVENFVQARGRRVEEVMTRDVTSVTEETPLERVVSLMRDRRIKRVPVMRGDKLVGIVSRADLVRALGRNPRGAGGGAG